MLVDATVMHLSSLNYILVSLVFFIQLFFLASVCGLPAFSGHFYMHTFASIIVHVLFILHHFLLAFMLSFYGCILVFNLYEKHKF